MALGGAASTEGALAQQTDAAVLARGRALAALFYAVKVDEVWSAFTPELRTSWGTLNEFRAYREMGVRVYGAEARVVGERVLSEGGLRYYVRTAVFAKQPRQSWAVVFGFNGAGRVERFTIALVDEDSGDEDQKTLGAP